MFECYAECLITPHTVLFTEEAVSGMISISLKSCTEAVYGEWNDESDRKNKVK